MFKYRVATKPKKDRHGQEMSFLPLVSGLAAEAWRSGCAELGRTRQSICRMSISGTCGWHWSLSPLAPGSTMPGALCQKHLRQSHSVAQYTERCRNCRLPLLLSCRSTAPRVVAFGAVLPRLAAERPNLRSHAERGNEGTSGRCHVAAFPRHGPTLIHSATILEQSSPPFEDSP